MADKLGQYTVGTFSYIVAEHSFYNCLKNWRYSLQAFAWVVAALLLAFQSCTENVGLLQRAWIKHGLTGTMCLLLFRQKVPPWRLTFFN